MRRHSGGYEINDDRRKKWLARRRKPMFSSVEAPKSPALSGVAEIGE